MADAHAGNGMVVRFEGGKRVVTTWRGHTIATDQPVAGGGDDTAPSPFDLFLASLGTCAGYYVLQFCAGRGIPLDGVRLEQRWTRDPETKRITAIDLAVIVPKDFPVKYHDAVARAAATCAVKKVLEQPPAMAIQVQSEL